MSKFWTERNVMIAAICLLIGGLAVATTSYATIGASRMQKIGELADQLAQTKTEVLQSRLTCKQMRKVFGMLQTGTLLLLEDWVARCHWSLDRRVVLLYADKDGLHLQGKPLSFQVDDEEYPAPGVLLRYRFDKEEGFVRLDRNTLGYRLIFRPDDVTAREWTLQQVRRAK